MGGGPHPWGCLAAFEVIVSYPPTAESCEAVPGIRSVGRKRRDSVSSSVRWLFMLLQGDLVSERCLTVFRRQEEEEVRV